MSAGINYTGGRGRIPLRQSKDAQRPPREHLAKRRFVQYTGTAESRLALGAIPLSPMTFKHVPRNALVQEPLDEVTERNLLSTCTSPNVADKPNAPMDDSRVLENIKNKMIQNESFEASITRIITMNTKNIIGLDGVSKKRKRNSDCDNVPPKQRLYYALEAEPRKYPRTPSIEPNGLEPQEQGEFSSFGSLSSTIGTQSSPCYSLEKLNSEDIPSRHPTPVNRLTWVATTQSQGRPASPIIPPNLWMNACLRAVQTLGLSGVTLSPERPRTVQDVPVHAGVDRWIYLNRGSFSSPKKDDKNTYHFNLFAPAQDVMLQETSAEPEYGALFTVRTGPRTRLANTFACHQFERDNLVIRSAPAAEHVKAQDCVEKAASDEEQPGPRGIGTRRCEVEQKYPLLPKAPYYSTAKLFSMLPAKSIYFKNPQPEYLGRLATAATATAIDLSGLGTTNMGPKTNFQAAAISRSVTPEIWTHPSQESAISTQQEFIPIYVDLFVGSDA